MSERDELQARLEARGVEFDRRLGVDKLRQLAEETSGVLDEDVEEEDELEDEDVTPVETIPVVTSTEAPLEEVWPRQVAPLVWVDRSGRRFTDLGAAQRADEEIR